MSDADRAERAADYADRRARDTNTDARWAVALFVGIIVGLGASQVVLHRRIDTLESGNREVLTNLTQRATVSLRVDDRDFIPGRDDIDLFATNPGDVAAIVETSALLRVGDTQCEVALQGERILEPGRTGELLVDGSRRIVSAADGEHQCHLFYSVLQPSSGLVNDQVFRFTCEKLPVPGGGPGIQGDNLC